jgi:hypothetical protein
MKMQKVEVELPVFDGYEFYKLAKINDLYLYDIDCFALCDGCLVDICIINSKNIEICIYKRIEPRKIIYQEIKKDYLKRGDFYRDDDGDVNMWISDMQSLEKHPIIKKVHDDFGENHD